MDPTPLQNIRTHKVSAANAREFGELELALQEALSAISGCETYLRELRTSSPPDTEKVRRTARELADSYGVAGGILRRTKDYQGALEMYEKGARLERDPQLEIENTYNLTNALVTKVIAQPYTFNQNYGEIEEARQLVEKQLQQTRRQDWWAWADLGTLALLEGNPRLAVSAFLRFREQGATAANCEKAATVVREIGEAVSSFAPDVARGTREIANILAPQTT
jgi:tetratricopeptide (TPR) repeat protein